MQATFQTQRHIKVYKSRIIKELEAEAHENMKGKKLFIIDDADENVTQKIIEFNRIQKWISKKDIEDQEKHLKNLKRIKSEAIGMMVEREQANKRQLKELHLTEDDILFEIELKKLLADWVELESDVSLSCRKALRHLARDGEKIDYSILNALQTKLKLLKDRENCLMQNRFNSLHKEESFLDISEEIKEITVECVQTKREITQERRRIGKQKSKVPNLCYFILYDDSYQPYCNSPIEVIHDPVTSEVKGYEYIERVNYRIQHLSKYYLTIMVGVICNIYNDYYKDEREKNSKTLKKLKRQTKKISIQEKKELIRLGKSEGLTNKEISRQLGKGFGLRTVERYCS